MECGVCWHVYDPTEGDPDRRVPPGTAFTALPQDWRCPICDATRIVFVRPNA
ncbi:rubredoxin [Rhodovastum atsumiense]|uniref:Rubredoxin n=2 Tax=Rhodovastum atsumiense TaxID=504468 RepID=A0A5M6IL34_9PROT|nr:rubredoxin [Rhodovastum atsumiense]